MDRKPAGYWTKELVQEEALKYNTRSKFQRKSSGAFRSAHRNGWLDEVCSHMKKQTIWTKELLQTKALKYNTRIEFQKNEATAYQRAYKDGLLDEICSHMKFLRTRWTKELLQTEALKYDSRKKFEMNNYGAYYSAAYHSCLDEICSHMETQFIWTKELLTEEALKYNTRSEFQRENSGAYSAAYKKGWLDDVCDHMEKQQILLDIVYMWNTVENPHIWKFGISNHYTYEKRINKVLSQTEYTLNEVLWIQTTDANKIETQLLKLGTPHIFQDVEDGKTEFRYLSENDEQTAKAIFKTSNISELFE